MFELKNAKTIARNAPKYTAIVEPFGDNGSIAFEMSKKKPKTHILNIEDEMLFGLLMFLQNLSSSDKKALKGKDWISSPETFEAVAKITDVEGVDAWYKFMYQKNFGAMDKATMLYNYDWLTVGDSIKSKIYKLPIMKIALKGVTIINEDAMGVVSKPGFLILNPKTPEQIAALDSKVKSLSGDFIYIKKSKSNEDLAAAVEGSKNKVSTMSGTTIMVGTLQVITNYENKLEDLSLKLEMIK